MINDIICKLFVIICHRICVIFLQDMTSLTCTVDSPMAIYDNKLELENLLCIVTKSGVWDSLTLGWDSQISFGTHYLRVRRVLGLTDQKL